MIAVDTSALLAILFQEPGAEQAAKALTEASNRYLSAANFVEAAIVVEARKGAEGALEFDSLIASAGVEIVPITEDLARAARSAWRRYGKGRHPAALNYGDCFAFGLAAVRSLPLLAIGEDFAKTDLSLVMRPQG